MCLDWLFQESFSLIVRHIAPKKSAGAIAKLLETLDPFNHDVVTFSDAASCLLGDIRSKKPLPNNKPPVPPPATIVTTKAADASQSTKPLR